MTRIDGTGDQSNGNKSPLFDKYFVLIGAGGAAKALAYGAKQRGARVFIANRNLGIVKHI